MTKRRCDEEQNWSGTAFLSRTSLESVESQSFPGKPENQVKTFLDTTASLPCCIGTSCCFQRKHTSHTTSPRISLMPSFHCRLSQIC